MAEDKTVNELVINKLTQAQYDAIPEAERSDTELYFITDANEDTLTKTEAAETYLPLSGGEVTGRIAFNTPPVPNASVPIIAFSKNSSVNLFIANSASGVPNNLGVKGNFVVTDNISTNSLGNTSKKVETAYIKTLNNGADLALPTEGGILARLEDIPEDTQLETLPVASDDNLNKIYQYVGETTLDYTQGYFYKSIKTTTENIVGSGYTFDAETKIVVNVRSDQFLSRNPIFADPSISNTQYPAWRADYSGAGFWNVWTQTPNISISETELTNIWGISIVDENGLPYTPESGDSIAIMQQEEINYHWEEINFSEDCLPLGGGTLTGPLDISGAILSSKYDNELKIGLVGIDEIITMNLASGSIISVTDSGSLGSGEHKWKTVYTNKLNNGADLVLPTEGGTLARTEDINAAVGDISTALTAILGE